MLPDLSCYWSRKENYKQGFIFCPCTKGVVLFLGTGNESFKETGQRNWEHWVTAGEGKAWDTHLDPYTVLTINFCDWLFRLSCLILITTFTSSWLLYQSPFVYCDPTYALHGSLNDTAFYYWLQLLFHLQEWNTIKSRTVTFSCILCNKTCLENLFNLQG